MGKSKDKDEDDGEGGGDGSTGGQSGGGFIPSYFELFGIGVDEQELAKLASQALFDNRISVKSKGFDVSALSKIQELKNRLGDPALAAELAASGINLQEHPELADQGGDIDPNIIVLPESEAAARASNDPKLQNKLRNRLAAKLGMSRDVSLQAMQEEYKKKMEMRIRPKPGEEPPAPRITPTPRPRPY
jgi:hypothetical protein